MADEEVGLLDQHSAVAEATAPAATVPAVRVAPPAARAAATPYDAIRLYLKTRGFSQAWLTKVRRNFVTVTIGRRRPKSGDAYDAHATAAVAHLSSYPYGSFDLTPPFYSSLGSR
jgi:hypothetical protein